ncbi:hypothetical protein SAMN05216464_101497 [Mucilaginibacter pineti]|uniref:Uncharacterized protein n=1 Tax=Mucilaginibacter pineti TaxID=1391627 RepID=A0A1G6U3B6_9SPHI|nr:hypothetical protein [Mucilaginibacter pineti]SDD35176.1 hypothetical protein SAMN05216464_101497 [Mucilaginibacter pineti]
MNRQRHFQVLVFSFALLVVLLRPYAAYRIARRSDMAKDPVKANSLLQRLIKKKDEHHALADNDLIAVQQPKTGQILPIRFLFITQLLLALAPASKHFIAITSHIFRPYADKDYLLFAQLRI